MGETDISKFRDFWICGPLGTLTYGFEYAKSLYTYKKNPRNLFWTYCVLKLWTLEIWKSKIREKGWGHQSWKLFMMGPKPFVLTINKTETDMLES